MLFAQERFAIVERLYLRVGVWRRNDRIDLDELEVLQVEENAFTGDGLIYETTTLIMRSASSPFY